MEQERKQQKPMLEQEKSLERRDIKEKETEADVDLVFRLLDKMPFQHLLFGKLCPEQSGMSRARSQRKSSIFITVDIYVWPLRGKSCADGRKKSGLCCSLQHVEYDNVCVYMTDSYFYYLLRNWFIRVMLEQQNTELSHLYLNKRFEIRFSVLTLCLKITVLLHFQQLFLCLNLVRLVSNSWKVFTLCGCQRETNRKWPSNLVLPAVISNSKLKLQMLLLDNNNHNNGCMNKIRPNKRSLWIHMLEMSEIFFFSCMRMSGVHLDWSGHTKRERLTVRESTDYTYRSLYPLVEEVLLPQGHPRSRRFCGQPTAHKPIKSVQTLSMHKHIPLDWIWDRDW